MTMIERLTPAALMLVVLVTACSSTPATDITTDPGGGLLGTHTENPAFWEEWTPRTPRALSVSDDLAPTTVFDAWHIDDDAFRQVVWDPTFHVLNALEVRTDDEDVSRALQSLMSRLEPGVEPTTWELAFLSHRDGEAEGMILRIATADGAGIWLEAVRSADGPEPPKKWILRTEPAAEEVQGLTAWIHRTDDAWKVATAPGADAAEPSSSPAPDTTLSSLADLWTAHLWEAATGRDYLEPEFSFTENPGNDLATGWPAALGEPVERRQIDDFVTDTVFTPRIGDDGIGDF